MTAALLPSPALPAPPLPSTAATAYQRVLHVAVERELRLLGELASWVTTDGAERRSELAGQVDLVTRVLLEHHAFERGLLWPALLRSLPAAEQEGARLCVDAFALRASSLDSRLRGLATLARQWAVTGTVPTRDALVLACGPVADAVAESVACEEPTCCRCWVGTCRTASGRPCAGWRRAR